MSERVHLVTGRLAEHALRHTLERFPPSDELVFTLQVLPISVAALMTPAWIGRHIHVPRGTTRVLIPGYVSGDLSELSQTLGVAVERGPRDLRQLPEFFGQGERDRADLSTHAIQIIAEINHAPRLPCAEVLRLAQRLKSDGADLIDIGCDPGNPWWAVGDCVKALREAGCRVSIDSFDSREVELAVHAGAELVLSVNSQNRVAAADWGCEVVVIPDSPQQMNSLDETVEFLAKRGVACRIDAILEPIGLGLAESLGRYLEVRRRYPQAAMMMGIGNLTEMTDVDSAAINVLLLGFCEELGIQSVLTTQVVNWARTSVRECDIARRLVHFAVQQRVPPKRMTGDLVVLRDERLQPFGRSQLDEMAARIKDHNVRIFAEEGLLQVMRSGYHWSGTDPFALFKQLMADTPEHMDASHAFYLGYEMCKALTALTLSKEYRQDESLNWGYLTVAEQHEHRRSEQDRTARGGPLESGQ